MPNSTERWPDREYTANESASRAWDVIAAQDESAAIATVANEWGVASGAGHPLNASLIAGNPTVKMIGPRNSLWTVKYPYSVPSGATIPTNPLQLPPKILWQPGEQSEAIDRDWYDNPIVNSAGDAPTNPLHENFPTMFLTIKRWEQTYDVQKHFFYRNTLNKDRFTIFGRWIVEPGQCLCLGYSPEGEFDLNAQYVYVAYRFEFQKGNIQDNDDLYDGFKRRFLDQGINGWNTDGKKARLRFTLDNAYVSSPEKLDGRGRPLKYDLYTVNGENPSNNPDPLPDKVFVDGTGSSPAVFMKYLTKEPVTMSAIFN
jgi:hypothetical protein